MAFVTVTEAADLANVSRGTIYNKIQDGELSRTPQGIDTNELIRVFGDISLGHDGRNKRQKRSSNAGSDNVTSSNDEIAQALLARLDEADKEKAWLREQFEAKEAELKRRDEQVLALPSPGQVDHLQKQLNKVAELGLLQRVFGWGAAMKLIQTESEDSKPDSDSAEAV